MKNRIRILLTVLMLLLATVLITSCGDEAPYASYGNVVTVEPGIYLPGQYGCRIEDMVLILDNGIRNFSASSKEMIEIF